MTTTPQLGVNWDDVTAEITSVLRDYLRINTSNPPGNEQAAAEFLATLLEAEGYECEYVEAGPGRVSMRSRLNGTGEERPLMLLNHTDVVPVQEEFWDVDPFAAVEQDGMLWGRGALDMKGMGTLELLVMLLFKRLNLTPNRDIVFLAVADEEAGSAYGMEWLDQNEQGWITEPEFALNEGGMGALNLLGSNRPVFSCSPSEKSPLWLKLRAEGQPGHGSTPHSDNAVERLIRALFAIQNWDRAVTVQPHTAEAIQRMRDANAWAGSAPSLNKLCQTYPAFAAVTRDTISNTGATSGIKHNVIPADAEATLDCRLLPGESYDDFIKSMRDVIDDEKVNVEVVFGSMGPSSSFETEMVSVIEDVVREQVEGALVIPSTCVGFTDSRVLRRHGVHSYGFVPTLMDASLAAGVHGHNERTPIEGLNTGIQILFEVVRRFTNAQRL
ncbi:MAG: M20/M25/M40 family metallo-hydrolase [Chloroflexi bacterium]|nr:M20/M25/M40 family metallo-hydrolase [Chloroflexota bacterium]